MTRKNCWRLSKAPGRRLSKSDELLLWQDGDVSFRAVLVSKTVRTHRGISENRAPVFADSDAPNSITLIERAMHRAQEALLARQDPAGFWRGELQGDSILESEYILLKFILEQENDPELPLIGNYLRCLQQADGGWSLFPGGPADLAGTVKAYFALKLMGDEANAAHMQKARGVVLK